MAKRTYIVGTVPEQTEYEIPFPIKRLLSIHIQNTTTSVWELLFASKVRSDRPSYSTRGSTIVLDPAPYHNCGMLVTVDV
jgi:hypothetical protein